MEANVDIDLDVPYGASKNMIIKGKNDKIVAIDPETGMWIRTNQSGADILRLCDGEHSINNIIKKVSKNEKIPSQMIKDSIIEFICHAKEAKLIWEKDKTIVFATQPRPLNKVVIHITWQCNLKCVHCYARDQKIGEPEMDATTIRKLITDFSEMGVHQIVISGGEPLLREDILDMIPQCDSKIVLITNGTMVDSNIAIKIKEKFDEVSVSIDGPDRKTHELFRGKNSFDSAIAGVKLLKETGIESLSICTTVTTANMNKMLDMLDLAQSLNCDISFGRFIPTNQHQSYLLPSGEAYSAVTQRIYQKYSDLYKRYSRKKTKLPSLSFDASATGAAKSMIFHKQPTRNCGAGETEISISPQGDVYPCPYLHKKGFKLGNIVKESIEDIRTAGYVFNEKINVRDFDFCSDCYLRYICAGGCRALALNTTGSLLGHDQYCTAYKIGFEGALFEG